MENYPTQVRRWLWPLFWLLCVVIAVVLLPRAWALRSLYLDRELRGHVRGTIEAVAREQGWLLSDMELRSVSDDRIRIVHRQHVRGADPKECVDALFASPELLPCDRE